MIEMNFNGAIADFTKAIEMDPPYIDAYYKFDAHIKQIKLKDYSGAIKDFFEYINLKDKCNCPDDYNIYADANLLTLITE